MDADTSSNRGNFYGGSQAWVSQEVRQGWVVTEVERRETRPICAQAQRLVALLVPWCLVARRIVAARVVALVVVALRRQQPQGVGPVVVRALGEQLLAQRGPEQQPVDQQPEQQPLGRALVEPWRQQRRGRARAASRADGRPAGSERSLSRHRGGEGFVQWAGRRAR
jgi:hypothetical protein